MPSQDRVPIDSKNPTQRIERVVQPDAGLAELIFDHHTRIFEAVLDDHPLYQGLFDNDFSRLVDSPDSVFYLAWMGDQLAGHLIVSNEIHDVKWLSGPYFQLHFPEEFSQRKLHYVASLGADAGCSPRLVRGLIDALTVDIAKVGGVAIADFRMTKSNARLPILIAGRNNALSEASFMRMPSEQFVAFRMVKLREEPLNMTEGIRTIVEDPGWEPPVSALGIRI